MEAFFGLLHEQTIGRDMEDNLVWLNMKSDNFTIKSSFSNGRVEEVFPFGTVRNSWGPSGISFFAWEVMQGRILTLD